jgi:hypothetical protein
MKRDKSRDKKFQPPSNFCPWVDGAYAVDIADETVQKYIVLLCLAGVSVSFCPLHDVVGDFEFNVDDEIIPTQALTLLITNGGIVGRAELN